MAFSSSCRASTCAGNGGTRRLSRREIECGQSCTGRDLIAIPLVLKSSEGHCDARLG